MKNHYNTQHNVDIYSIVYIALKYNKYKIQINRAIT